MSLRLGISRLLHLGDESVEEITDIVGAWTSLGMALEAERRAVGPPESLQRTVKERHVGDLAVPGQRFPIHRKTMVL